MSTLGHQKYTQEQFLQAIAGSGGIISTIGTRIGCTWATARKYIDNDPELKSAYQDECEKIIDLAESVLIKSIQGGNTQDAKWLLSRLRREKYAERQEIEHIGTAQVEIVFDDEG